MCVRVLHIQAAAAGPQGVCVGVTIDEYDLEPAERHTELVREMEKLYFEEEESQPAMT
jgi:hypothetical protein